MNFFSKYRTVLWILIILLIINASALVTFLFCYCGSCGHSPASGNQRPRCILRQELSLTKEQTLKVDEINRTYKMVSGPVMNSIIDKKAELLRELAKENTDTGRLAAITEELGIRQKLLQQANIRQFLELKKVCTPDQTIKLAGIYTELYGCSGKYKCKEMGKGNCAGKQGDQKCEQSPEKGK